MEKTENINITLIIIGLLIMLHHYIFWQRIADLKDILHHEFFEVIFLTAGIALLISNHCNKKRSE
jgi:uncharacterized membrane protein YidH (DUF202 family)